MFAGSQMDLLEDLGTCSLTSLRRRGALFRLLILASFAFTSACFSFSSARFLDELANLFADEQLVILSTTTSTCQVAVYRGNHYKLSFALVTCVHRLDFQLVISRREIGIRPVIPGQRVQCAEHLEYSPARHDEALGLDTVQCFFQITFPSREPLPLALLLALIVRRNISILPRPEQA